MPLVQRNGLTFHSQVLGEGEPVCLLHGLLVGSLATWYFGAAPRLAKKRKVLVYDLRGHGQSERAPTGYGLSSMADDLDAMLEDFAPPGGPKVTLVGHSYGALVALHFALLQPGRVARLALIEAPLPPWRVDEVGDLSADGPDQMLKALPPTLADSVRRGGRAAGRLVDRLRFLMTESSLSKDLAQETGFNLTPSSPLMKALPSLKMPVLCLYGSRSSCRPVGEKLARAIRGAQLKIVEGGHFLPAEAPQALADELERFLDG
jgi:pimeloyl-ACP methyl ester carboxylesterase